MKSRRLTIGRAMGGIAIIAANAALVRAFVVQEMFTGGIVMMIVLQLGLWGFLKSQGRRRCFWIGFEVAGIAAVLALFSCDIFPDSLLNRVVTSYTSFADNLAFTHLPTSLSDYCDEHQHILLVVVYFVPELILALLAGMITCLLPRRQSSIDSIDQQTPTSFNPSFEGGYECH